MRNRAAPTIAVLFAASSLWAASACGSFSAADDPTQPGDAAGGAAEGAADGPGGDGSIGAGDGATGGPGRRIYVVGGETPDITKDAGVSFTNRVFYTTRQSDGALAPWTETTAVLSHGHGYASVASSGAIVTLGGEVDTPAGATAIPYTSRAAVLPGGTLDTWVDTQALPDPLYFHASVAVNGLVYVIGGSKPGTGPLAKVRFASLAPEGKIGTWTETAPLPVPRSRVAAATDGAHIFVVGGFPPAGGNSCEPEVLVGTIAPDGQIAAWAPTGVTVASRSPAVAVFAKKLYVTGGIDCVTGITKTVQIAAIKPDGTLAPFTAGAVLPVERYGHGAVVLGSQLYVVGGNDGTTSVPSVSVANLGANGDYDTWRDTSALPVGLAYFGIAAH